MNRERVLLLESAMDHLSGEEIGAALTALNALPEILDALYLPGIGKKNRPAGLLQVLCRPEAEAEAVAAVFRHTHTLGIRRQELERYVLERKPTTVKLAGATLAAKSHCLEGREYLRPEADAIADLATKLGIGAPGVRFGPGSNA